MKVIVDKGKYDWLHQDSIQYNFRFSHEQDRVSVVLPEEQGYQVYAEGFPLDVLREVVRIGHEVYLYSGAVRDAEKLLEKWEPQENVLRIIWLNDQREALLNAISKLQAVIDGINLQITALEVPA